MLKKDAKEFKIGQQITKRNKLFAQQIVKFLRDFNSTPFEKSAKQIENSLADYHTKKSFA